MSYFYYLPESGDASIGRMSQPIQSTTYRNHFFYAGTAVAFALSVFVGFSRTYYFRGLFGTPHLSTLKHIHGAVFTLWMVFFVCQTLLVSAGRTDLHRRIGWAGAIFALAIAVLGGVMTFQSVRDGYASGRPGMALLLINGVIDLLLFCGFFAFALIFRGRKEIHKRLMMLAMISLIIPALGRFPVPGGMIKWVICAFSLTGVIYDLVFLRRLYLTNIVGALLINAGSPLRFMIADTEAWQKFSEWFTR
jgi:hypothetical protein